MMEPRLLGGPPATVGAESYAAHVARLGPLPAASDRRSIVSLLESTGLLGRGGGAFPVGRKWRSVAERGRGAAVVLANGAEGEPLSAKDRTLMAARPHLVLDGAVLAAEAVGADRIALYVGSAHTAARASIARAIAERAGQLPVPTAIVDAPDTYIAGEESAAVHFVNAGDARPTATPPRPFERGVGGRPTLVQNVESLAHAALIARRGDEWYTALGRGPTRGTALVTVGSGERAGVQEIELGSSVGEVAGIVGARREDHQAVLLGGYFGGWASLDQAWDLALDPIQMRADGMGSGCGVVSFLPDRACGVRATAEIVEYMAGQSAAQCGPCVFGLRAIADATARLANLAPDPGDLDRIARWTDQLAGRGACRHPDGAVGLMHSALGTFGDEFAAHGRRRCERVDLGRWAA